jgi:hypothetical protein
MKTIQAGTDSEWQSIKAASRQLKRSTGQLTRLCRKRLHGEGKARVVTGGGKKRRWEIRSDFAITRRWSCADLEPVLIETPAPAGGVPIRITIGDLTIIIQHGTAPAVPTPGMRRREAFKRPSKAV